MSKQSRRPPQEEKPSRRSWRGAENGSAAQAPAAQMGWRQGRAPRNELARKWMIGVPMIVVVLGLLVGWYVLTFRRPPPTPLVTAYITDYEAPLEPQAFAREDVEQLLSLFRPSGRTGSITVKGNIDDLEMRAADKDRFLAQFREQLLAQKPLRAWGHNKPQLIYLSAQGVLNEAGEPCLVLAAGQRDPAAQAIRTPRQVLSEPQRLVPMEDLLDLVAEVHPGANKVLLLDSVRADRNWRLGVAASDFAAQLKALKLNTPARERIVIVHACSPGEVGLVDLHKGRTLFGQFVARGLAGEADANKNEQVELREFVGYLRDELKTAAQRRGRTQEPLLVASSDKLDFPLATADSTTKAVADTQLAKAVYQPAPSWLDEIHAGFAAVGAQASSGPAGGAPSPAGVLIREAQRQHWQQQLKYCLAGAAYAKYREDFPLKSAGEDWSLPGVSLPLALGRLDLPSDELDRGRAALMPPPADKPPPAEAAPASAADYRQMAAARWEEALQGVAAVPFAAAKLDQARRQSVSILPVELRTIQRLSPQNPHLPAAVREASDVLRQLLVCRNAAERAAFLGGQPRVLPLVQARLDQADAQRRAAEDAVFGGQIDSAGLTKLAQEFGAIQTQADQVAAAFAVRDRLWANLPYLLEWAVLAEAEQQTQAAALLQALGKIEQALAAGGGAPVDWPKLTAAVEAAEREIFNSYTAQWRANVELTPAEGVLSQAPALERLLSVPLGNLDARRQLWDKYWSIVAAAPSDQRPANYKEEIDRIATQRPAAQTLLAQWLDTVPGGPAPDASRLSPTARFYRLMDQAAAATAPLDAKDLADAELRQALAEREPASRAAASWLTLGSSSTLGNHLIGQRAELAAYDFCLWQAQRSLDDFLSASDQPSGASPDASTVGEQRPYFAQSAAALLDYAETKLFPRRKATALRQLLAARERDAAALAGVVLAWPNEPIPTGENSATVERLPMPLDVTSLPAGQAALRVTGDWKQAAVGDAAGTLTPVMGDLLRKVAATDAGWPERFRFMLDPAKPEQSGASGDVTYYYRGHAVTLRGRIDRLQPKYRVASTSPGNEGKLAVDSPTVKANIVIMLDCSNSMRELSGEKTRLARGREAVQRTIQELLYANQGADPGKAETAAGDAKQADAKPAESKRRPSQIKVTLVLFGHRRGQFDWPRNGVANIAWNAAFGPDTGVPYDQDYDIVWTNRGWKSDQQAQAALQKVMSGTQPMGFTPLYGALEYGLNKGFAGGDDPAADGPRHLVVVSDGQDLVPTLAAILVQSKEPPGKYQIEQFRPAWSQSYSSEDSRRSRAARVRTAADGVNMYFFNVANDDSLLQVKSDLQLSDEQIVPIGANVELTAELLRRIGVRKYAVVDRERGTRLPGSSTMPEVFPRSIGRHALLFSPDDTLPKSFRIGGGEALEVTIPAAPNEAAFAFARQPAASAAGAARGQITVDPGTLESDFREALSAYEVLCRAERARRGERNDDQCKFELVLQNKSPGQFTPRPVELWAEVTPIDRSGMPLEKFAFASPFCAPGTRVPVYQLLVPKWPAGATQAKVSVWLRMRATAAVESPLVTYGANAERRPAAPGDSGGAEFKFEAREDKQGAVVKITEFPAAPATSAGSSSPSDQLHFVRPESDLNLVHVERTYYEGQVEHQFTFTGRTLQDAQATRVLAVPLERWKASATPLDGGQPLEVSIPAE